MQKRPVLPWFVWGVAAFSYGLAVANRSSLAALGPTTQSHFHIDATTLSLFAVLQLIVYAGLQIPVGFLLDRFGPRALILTGSILMVAGQLTMATVHQVWLAILARVLVGAGDACTFVSVMRILPDWFTVRHIPLLSQVTGLIGQAGQLLSVTPLALAVSGFGWAAGFTGLAGLGILATILGFLILRPVPGDPTIIERFTHRLGRISRDARPFGSAVTQSGHFTSAPPATGQLFLGGLTSNSLWQRIKMLFKLPGVRLAFWVHWTAPFSCYTFVMLWGTPYLEGALKLDHGTARLVLNIIVVMSVLSSLLLGTMMSRFLRHRVTVYLWIVAAIILCWVALLLWPGQPPLWLLLVSAGVIAFGGPASMIAFEVMRSHTPRSFVSLATGFVNTGAFAATLSCVLVVGLILDLEGAGSPENYTRPAFDLAFAAQGIFWLIGIAGIFWEKRNTAIWMRKHGRTL